MLPTNTIIGTGGHTINPVAIYSEFIVVLYFYAVTTFVMGQWFLGLTFQDATNSTRRLRIAAVLFQFITCLYIGLQDVWINHDFKVYFQTTGILLPDITLVVLYKIPTGAFTIVAIILWAANTCFRFAQLSPYKVFKDSFHIAFVVFCLVFLLVIPLALACPFLNI